MAKLSSVKKQGPDQGFAWVVAFACFLINFIMAGLARSAGVLYVALIDLYGASRETATMPFSIRVSVRNLCGPIVGMLGQRYGIRAVTLSGGVFAAVGGMLCYFAPNILWITIFWGIIHGIGFGLSTVIHMVIINQYFDKYRATALGLGYTGDCIGSFALPVIIDSLLYDYGIKETFLIIGGIVLNVVPLAMLLKSPSWLKQPPKKRAVENVACKNVSSYENSGFTDPQQLSTNNSNFSGNSKEAYTVKTTTENDVPSYEEATKSSNLLPHHNLKTKADATNSMATEAHERITDCYCNNKTPSNDQITPSAASIGFQTAQSENKFAIQGDAALNHPTTDYGAITTDDHKTTVSEIDNVSILKTTDGVTEIVMESRDLNHGNVLKTTITEHGGNGCDTVLRIRTLSESRRLGIRTCESRSASINEASTPHVNDSREYRSHAEPASIEVCQEVKLRTGNVEVIQNPISSSIVISYDNEAKLKEQDQKVLTLEHYRSAVSVNGDDSPIDEEETIYAVLRNAAIMNVKPIFILISVTMAVYSYLFIAVLTVIIDFGVDKGIDSEQGKYFIIAFSAADLVGRLGFGVVIDRKWAPMKHYVALTVGGMGFFVSVIPLVSGFWALMAGMLFFGLVQGGVAIVFPILVAEYMEKKEESLAMGCLNFHGGLLMLCMAPMIGFFRDKYGTYDSMFHLVGLCCLGVGFMWSMEPLILKCQTRRKEDTNIVTSSCNKEE